MNHASGNIPDGYRDIRANIRAVTHTGFFVATNIKIRQGAWYESTKYHRLLTL
jgi:hypothetical protein